MFCSRSPKFGKDLVPSWGGFSALARKPNTILKKDDPESMALSGTLFACARDDHSPGCHRSPKFGKNLVPLWGGFWALARKPDPILNGFSVIF